MVIFMTIFLRNRIFQICFVHQKFLLIVHSVVASLLTLTVQVELTLNELTEVSFGKATMFAKVNSFPVVIANQ